MTDNKYGPLSHSSVKSRAGYANDMHKQDEIGLLDYTKFVIIN